MRWWNGFSLLLVGVLGTLMLFSFARRSPSTGVTLLVSEEFDPETTPDFPALDLGDDRAIVLQVKADSLYVNQDKVELSALPILIKRIMEPRSQRFLFVRGDIDVEYQRFVEAVNAAHSEVPDIRVILITERDENSERFSRLRLPGDPQGRYLLMPIAHLIRLKRTPWHFVDNCESAR